MRQLSRKIVQFKSAALRKVGKLCGYKHFEMIVNDEYNEKG